MPPPAPPESLYDPIEEAAVVPAFLPYAKLLRMIPCVGEAVTVQEEEDDAEIAAKVTAHFTQHRPAPNSFPGLSLRVLNLLANPLSDAPGIAKLVRRDAALSASVLKVANSAAYQGSSEVTTLQQAVVRLGVQEVGRIAGVVSARSVFSPQVRQEFALFGARWNRLFHESLCVAQGSAALAMGVPGAHPDRAFLGGMFHDVGKAIALRSVAALILQGQLRPDLSPDQLDRVLHQVHIEVGGETHQTWGLPNYLTAVCVRHHEDNLPSDQEFADLHCVRLVSALRLIRSAPMLNEHAAVELYESARALGLSPHALRATDTQLSATAESVAQLLRTLS